MVQCSLVCSSADLYDLVRLSLVLYCPLLSSMFVYVLHDTTYAFIVFSDSVWFLNPTWEGVQILWIEGGGLLKPPIRNQLRSCVRPQVAI